MMIKENVRAREIIDEASSMRFSPERGQRLKTALSELGSRMTRRPERSHWPS